MFIYAIFGNMKHLRAHSWELTDFHSIFISWKCWLNWNVATMHHFQPLSDSHSQLLWQSGLCHARAEHVDARGILRCLLTTWTPAFFFQCWVHPATNQSVRKRNNNYKQIMSQNPLSGMVHAFSTPSSIKAITDRENFSLKLSLPKLIIPVLPFTTVWNEE